MAHPLPIRLMTAARTYSRAQTTMARAQDRAERAAGLLRGAAAATTDGRLAVGAWWNLLDQQGSLTVAAAPQVAVDQLPLPLEG
ncbi:MAG: hypothetical protein M0027_08455 [Candidatus Dormibacteraeota bacterium]|nr:hypothetical protein [Candidatus Dormibacteraeota bacterium]